MKLAVKLEREVAGKIVLIGRQIKSREDAPRLR
jgi:hypothetical protein